MAEQDKDQKTEEPTAKRLRKAVQQGNVVTSQEVKSWFMFTAMLAAIWVGGPWFAVRMMTKLQGIFQSIPSITSTDSGFLEPMRGLIIEVMLLLLIPFLFFMITAVVSNTVQHPFVVSFEKIKPNLGKLNPITGLKKFGNIKTLVEAGKNVLKLVAIASIVFVIVWPERAQLDSAMFLDIYAVVEKMWEMAIKILIGMVVFLTIVAAIDYSFQKWKYMKDLRMTKQEVKDEHKLAEGDPLIKGKIKSLRLQRHRERMMANVPYADVVVTNPTHYAIALEYKHGEMDVPKLTAKGVDGVAAKIREIAEENDIPVIENPPLARALYADVDVDEEIPPAHYKTVAEVIGYVMKLRRSGLAPEPKQRPQSIPGFSNA